ncbi:hypothetical protein THASP1DRAFT_33519 [Thamnocephalis sphaerospora]|uniref:Uncharacterized protein n=1 Tax=Thamnocephalis sphaerospora TaxID=78915 RepID=A0A4P9XGE7_9FUNG|nr:hypothetical protein THASP1DRAFT_33519 [Thamnocephalis sphaerospora]|eukprot:RKP04682.1 hypothetical protein THASP1DRAFT_33519 [Thamnocephalis sphaerospora]
MSSSDAATNKRPLDEEPMPLAEPIDCDASVQKKAKATVDEEAVPAPADTASANTSALEASPEVKEGEQPYIGKLGLEDVRVNKAPKWDYAYITLKDAATMEACRSKLEGAVMKSNTLHVGDVDTEARDKTFERRRDQRRAEEENDTRTPAERLADQVTPLHKLPYEKQLENKQGQLRSVMFKFHKEMKRISANASAPLAWVDQSGKDAYEIAEIIPSPVQQEYRTKCEFTIGKNPEGEPTVGFLLGLFKDGQVSVLNANDCLHVHPVAKKIAERLQESVRASQHPVYDRVSKQGVWRGMLVKTQETGENLVLVQFNPASLSDEEVAALKQAILDTFSREDNDFKITTLMVQASSEEKKSKNA